MKRTICILLALLVLSVFTLSGCDEPGETSSPVSQESNESESALVPHLGTTSAHSGKSLNILTIFEDVMFGKEQFTASEILNEPVNDASFERANLLKQTYGFDIVCEFTPAYGEYITRVRDDIFAGTVTYDVCASGSQSLATLAADGSFIDLFSSEMSALSLESSWWDVAAIEDLTIKNRLFFAPGDILIIDDEYTRCIFYNKDTIDEYDLESPSQLVYDDKWVLDTMYTMAKSVAHEGGDNNNMDVTGEDKWGLVCDAFDTYSLVLGSDCPQVSKDGDDIPVLMMAEEKNIAVFLKVYEFMSDKNVTAYTEEFYRWNDADASKVKGNFYNGKSLFLIGLIANVNSDNMRNADIRYGILPMPKYDLAQENYATTINPYQFMCVSVLNDCKDTEFVSFALEAMAYLGEKMITPEYYERTLKNKRFLDDDDSPEMLDIIFSNRLIDLSVMYNWDDCIQYYNRALTGGGNIRSLIESEQSSFETALAATLEAFGSTD